MKQWLAVLLIVMIAGCSAPMSEGDGTVSVNREYEENTLKDVLVIEQVDVPRSSVFPDEEFEVVIRLANKDEQELLEKVTVEMFDTSVFSIVSNTPECVSSECDIPPLGEKEIVFNLKAPSETYVQGKSIDGTVSYRVLYTFKGHTTYEIPIINFEEVRRLERAGSSMTISPVESKASGPIIINVDIVDRDYALADRSAILKFELENKGSGNIRKAVVFPYAFSVHFHGMPETIGITPPGSSSEGSSLSSEITGNIMGITGFGISDWFDSLWEKLKSKASGWISETAEEIKQDMSEYFQEFAENFENIYQGIETGDIVSSPDAFRCELTTCANSDIIEMYKGKSGPLIFKIDNLPEVPVFVNYPIYAFVIYQYELRGQQTIKVVSYGG